MPSVFRTAASSLSSTSTSSGYPVTSGLSHGSWAHSRLSPSWDSLNEIQIPGRTGFQRLPRMESELRAIPIPQRLELCHGVDGEDD